MVIRKMKIAAFLLIVFLIQAGGVFAADKTLQSQFDQANEAYFARDFKRAIDLYTDLEKRGIRSGDLFFNLGNTYYRLGQVGRAVFYYTKALRYHPRDRDLAANYRYILSKRADKIEEPLLSKVYHRLCFWVDLMTLKELLILGAACYIVLFVFWGLWIARRKMVFTLALLAVAAVNVVLLPTAAWKFYDERLRTTGVLISPVVSVFSEPAAGAIKILELHEGTVAQVTDYEGSFAKIRLPDGKRGWVNRSDLQEI